MATTPFAWYGQNVPLGPTLDYKFWTKSFKNQFLPSKMTNDINGAKTRA